MAERLGRYTVLKHLASGGMADVLLARTDGIEGFERHVVLKRIRAEHAKDQRFIDMFLDEARLAANLHHQNIVQVHDIGEAAGEYFFAMEYLHGEDLRTLLSSVAKTRTHMPLGHVVTIVSAVAAGLHYAHERRSGDKKPLNIVHRDVSPSNIIIGYDGSVKVVDFGIAKAAMRQVETRSGSLKGKVSYMSPEQCKMTSIDRRSDIYALGVVLYELATTTRLFKSDSDYLVMDAICTGKIPLPRVRRPDLPNELSTIIMTCLATDPERRYQTADELRVALDQFAIKYSLTSAAGALATYLTKLFGERPEPWLETSSALGENGAALADTIANGRSWTELPIDLEAATRTGGGGKRAATGSQSGIRPSDEAKTITDGKRKIAAQVAVEPTDAAPVADRTSTRMAWEHEGSLPPAPPSKLSPQKIAMVAIPVLALVGFGIWKFTAGGGDGARDPAGKVAAASPTTPSDPGAVAPAPAPTVTPVQEPMPAPAVAPPSPAPAPVRDATVDKKEPPPKAEPVKVEPKKPEPAKPAEAPKKPEPAKVEVKKPEPAKPAEAPKKPEPAKVETKPTTPAPVAATPPPAPAPAPVEPQIAKLSHASVEGVASQHRGELSKCEGTGELHGEVTVKFEVNAAGRVVKSQVASTLSNPKVSGCILRTIQGWTFPKPASGAAEGVYTMSYQ